MRIVMNGSLFAFIQLWGSLLLGMTPPSPLVQVLENPRQHVCVTQLASPSDDLPLEDQSVLGSPFIQSDEGVRIHASLSEVEAMLPSSLSDLVARYPHYDVQRLAKLIFQLRNQQSSAIQSLAASVTNLRVRQAFIRTAQRIAFNQRDEPLRARINRRPFRGIRLPVVRVGSLYGAVASTFSSDLMEAHAILENIFGPSVGFFSELKWALRVPGFVGLGLRLSEVISPRTQAQIVRSLGSGRARRVLTLELDIVYNHGMGWMEIKSRNRPTSVSRLDSMMDHLQALREAFAAMDVTGDAKPKMVYFFCRGGIESAAEEIIRSYGVDVESVDLGASCAHSVPSFSF